MITNEIYKLINSLVNLSEITDNEKKEIIIKEIKEEYKRCNNIEINEEKIKEWIDKYKNKK